MQILKRLFTFALLGFVLSINSYAQNCPEGTVSYQGACKPLRQTGTTRAPYVPAPIVNAEGVTLYPRPMSPECATKQLDSECVVTYSYTDTSLPPVISLSFTNTTNLYVNEVTTQLQWTSVNAVSISMSCSGVAYNISNVTVPTNATPYSQVFSSSQTGTQTCTLTGTNPFGNTATVTASVTFVDRPAAPKPTINVVWSPSPLQAGSPYTVNWTTTNATSVTQYCTTTGTGWGNASGTGTPSTLPTVSGSVSGTASSAWVGYPTNCTWTATGLGGETILTETVSTVATAPVLTVNRTNGLPMQYPGVTGSNWSTTNATALTLACTSANGGYTLPSTNMALSGNTSGATLSTWVGKTSVCTWTATGPGGTTVVTETLTTVNPANFKDVKRYRSGWVYHYEASDTARHNQLVAGGWIYEGVAFKAFTSSTSQLNTLYPTGWYYYGPTGAFWFSNLPSEMSQATAWGYTTLSTTWWYAQLNNSANGAVPLYRVYMPFNEGYFYTRSYTEAVNAAAGFGGWLDGNTMYVWP